MTTDASVVTCPTCGRKNRVPAAATGRPRCANCHNPLPWLAEADDDSFAECHRGGLGAPAAMAAAPRRRVRRHRAVTLPSRRRTIGRLRLPAWSALMAGWLMSRLALAPPTIRLIEAARAAVLIRARHDGRQATIAAEAVDDQEVQITTTVTNRPSRRRRLRLPTRSTAADLEAALTSRPGPDEIWERATAGALLLLEQR